MASRDGDRASRFTADLGISQSHASYQDLLEKPDVDAIYVALSNPMHAEWIIRAARAEKHGLCEKPVALDEAECYRTGGGLPLFAREALDVSETCA